MTKTPVYTDSFWRHATVYQIYPRSFNKIRPIGTADHGEGSLRGITAKLDYLKDLGIDVIWLSPFYPSPMIDSGYDVNDYTEVDARYGTLADFDEMIRAATQHGMKVMVDFVPNHTSDQHAWFAESSASRDNPKADWYIWHDATPDGHEPNNWASVFSLPQLEKRRRGELDVPAGQSTPPLSAWTWHEGRQQYYLHSFAAEQPDLNWSNPHVQAAMQDVMRFWLRRGVEGFRIDAFNYTGKDTSLADEALNPAYQEGIDNPYDQLKREHAANFDTLYAYVRILCDVLKESEFAHGDAHLIFETYVEQPILDRINAIYPERAAAFNFARMTAEWDAALHGTLIERYLHHLPAGSIPNHVNGNHDNDRLATRLGQSRARVAALINATLPGQMYIYQGEEAGFENADVPDALRDDVLGLRDGERTPMAWNAGRNGGFSTAPKTWLPLSDDYRTRNVAAEQADPESSWHLYRRLLALRRSSAMLRQGTYRPLGVHDGVLLYERSTSDGHVVIAANYSSHTVPVLRDYAGYTIVLSSLNSRRTDEVVGSDGLQLDPSEAVIIGKAASNLLQ